MDTKLKGDIAEQAAILHAMKHGFGVLKPIGDRLPYDLVFDVSDFLLKVQVKSAWLDLPYLRQGRIIRFLYLDFLASEFS
jgi:PD-(D/E)XK endonuclease